MNGHEKVREAIEAIVNAEKEYQKAKKQTEEADRRQQAADEIVKVATDRAISMCKTVFGVRSQGMVVGGRVWKYEYESGKPGLYQECKVIVLSSE